MNLQDDPQGGEAPRKSGIRPFLTGLGLLGGVALVAGALIAAKPDRLEPALPPPPRILSVETASVVISGHYEVEARFVGRIEAARASELGFELPGMVILLAAEEGEKVEADQLLARLDTARLEAQRSELEAAREEAAANQRLAALTYERTERLAQSGAVSQQRLDEAKRQVETAESAIARIEAQLASVEVDFGKSELRAPYTGVVVERRTDEGSVLGAGQPVFRILETNLLQVRAGLSPAAVEPLAAGGTVELQDSGGRAVTGIVTQILPERREGTRTVDVILEVRDSPASLRDGDLVDVIVPRRIEEPGAWLPRTALTESVRGLWATYALLPGEKQGVFELERRQIEVVHQDGERIFVRGALVDGEEVVASGLHRLVPGQRVKPVRALESAQN